MSTEHGRTWVLRGRVTSLSCLLNEQHGQQTAQGMMRRAWQIQVSERASHSHVFRHDDHLTSSMSASARMRTPHALAQPQLFFPCFHKSHLTRGGDPFSVNGTRAVLPSVSRACVGRHQHADGLADTARRADEHQQPANPTRNDRSRCERGVSTAFGQLSPRRVNPGLHRGLEHADHVLTSTRHKRRLT